MSKYDNDVYFGIDWGYGGSHFHIKETEERLRPFWGQKATLITIIFHDTQEVYRGVPVYGETPKWSARLYVDASFHWTFGMDNYRVNETEERMAPFRGKKAASILINFEDTVQQYYGVVTEDDEED